MAEQAIRASKENAREAQKRLAKIDQTLQNLGVHPEGNSDGPDSVYGSLNFVRSFLQAAVSRLPTEESYEADKERRAKKDIEEMKD